MASGFKELLEKLSTTKNKETTEVLNCIGEQLAKAVKNEAKNSPYHTELENSTFISALAGIMVHNKNWTKEFPQIKLLISFVYFRMMCQIPSNQTQDLVHACVSNLSIETIAALRCVATPFKNRVLLARIEELYDGIKAVLFKSNNKEMIKTAVRFLQVVSENCELWQAKILQDYNIIKRLLSFLPSDDVWILFGNLCHHSDAKLLFPREVLEKAIGYKSVDTCIDILAILSTESFSAFKLENNYISERAKILQTMLDHQTDATFAPDDAYSLLDLVLPLVNLSINDNYKDTLGERFIPLLVRVIEIQESTDLIPDIESCLGRSQIEAAMALWHLAFNEKNCKRIKEANGVKVLQQAFTNPLLQKIADGVLFMVSASLTPPRSPRGVRKHVMISYSSANQSIVLRLAEVLKENGYSIWLDTDQPAGGTSFSTMTDAIEQAALVLMCVSQKYKDSPNCRLQLKYCQMHRVDVLPIIVQKGYQPDGWLDYIQPKLEIIEDENMTKQVAALMNDIGNRGKSARISIRFTHSDIEVSHDHLELKDKIGQGGYGEVWKAKWNGKGGGIEVAVKKMRMDAASLIVQQQLISEVNILARLRHPNIIPIFAYSFTSTELWVVMEYIDAGTLFELLQSDRPLGWDVRMKIALQALRGVHHLHNTEPEPILHRDIKSLNYLITHDCNSVKLIDFGMSKVHSVANSITSGREFVGTLRWRAPETFYSPIWTPKADIYSLGITFYEIAAREIPFLELGDERLVYQVCTMQMRPELPKDCPREFAEIIYYCWDDDVDYRPTSVQLLDMLEKAIEKLFGVNK